MSAPAVRAEYRAAIEVIQALAGIDTCELCMAPRLLTHHHIIERARGGPWTLWNILKVCWGPGDTTCHEECQQHRVPEAVQFALAWERTSRLLGVSLRDVARQYWEFWSARRSRGLRW